MQNITLKKQPAVFRSFNTRAEHHGDDLVPGADIGFSTTLPNTFLNHFNPGLLDMLFRKAEGDEQDLFPDDTVLPIPRLDKVKMPLAWQEQLEDYHLGIYTNPGSDDYLTVEPVKVSKFKISPVKGGLISLEFSVSLSPDKGLAGELAMLVQHEVDITLHPVKKAS